MKRLICVLLAAILLAFAAGCSREDSEIPTANPETDDSSGSAQEAPAPIVTGDADTVILREDDDELRITYALIAVNPDAAFVDFMNNPVDTAPVINAAGADALVSWLLREDTLRTAREFGSESFGEALYRVDASTEAFAGEIPAAEKPEEVRVYAPEGLIESGLMDALTEGFAETCGCAVVLRSADTQWAVNSARRGKADLLLVKRKELEDSFLSDGFGRVIPGFEAAPVPYLCESLVLCGPDADPAGVRDTASLAGAYAAISETGSTYISSGVESDAYALELSLWSGALGITKQEKSILPHRAWYIRAETETGPALVMAKELGGYVLTDKLTFLRFRSYMDESFSTP